MTPSAFSPHPQAPATAPVSPTGVGPEPDSYWARALSTLGDPSVVIANGRYFVIGDEQGEMGGAWGKGARGHGGQRFVIQFFDARGRVVSTNLWNGSTIPQEFRHLFPDNARFVSAEEEAQERNDQAAEDALARDLMARAWAKETQ